MHIKQDVAAGVIFLIFGVLGLWLGADYEFGVARGMGPGYLPTLLCWALIGLGLIIVLRGARSEGELVAFLRLRPLVLILAAVGVFALLIESAGLALAVFATAVLSGFSGEHIRIGETVALALFLAVSAVAIFVYGLSLPISVFPS